MFEVRKFTPRLGRFMVIFSGYLLESAAFFNNLMSSEREHCFLAYVGDGTEGV